MTSESPAATPPARHPDYIYPEDRLPLGRSIALGGQHLIAMFGATALGPILMGFDPNVSIFFSGIATLIFYVAVGGKVPSYLGSSFAFIAAVAAATNYSGSGPNPSIALALGGIIVCGAIYLAVGVLVMIIGHDWIDRVMPPAVTGVIVAAIGLNLAHVAVSQISGAGETWIYPYIGVATIVLISLAAVYLPGIWGKLSILIGGGASLLLFVLATELFGLGPTINWSTIDAAPWFGVPNFTAPVFEWNAISLIAPVVIILLAENYGHVRAISSNMGRDLTKYIGRAFAGDGAATIVSGFGGGTGMTTYAENMGVMSVTKNYSSTVFVVAALFAIALGLSPKFGAAIQAIPLPVLGGIAFVVFGMITATAGQIWVSKGVDFAETRTLITVGVAAVIGAGDLSLNLFGFTLGGIATATFAALALYHLLGFRSPTTSRTETVDEPTMQ